MARIADVVRVSDDEDCRKYCKELKFHGIVEIM